LAAQVVRQRFLEAPLLIPESGKALTKILDGGVNLAGVVVWLDDLERFLGPDGLTMGLFNRLTSSRAILIATIRSRARETYRPRKELRPPEWEVLETFTRIELKRRHTKTELDRIRAALTDRPDVLAGVQHYGLAEYLGAGPLAVDKFESGETTEPVGHALVRAAVDWRRSGLTRPIPRRVLASSALVAVYLTDRPDVSRSAAALANGLAWATTQINETVALLGRGFDDPADDTSDVFEAFDYLVDHLSGVSIAIPEKLWQLSLTEAEPAEWRQLGYAAYQSESRLPAELAFRKAAEAGDSKSMFSLAVLLWERDEVGEAETWFRRTIEAGYSDEIVALAIGDLLKQRGQLSEAEIWLRRAADAGLGDAMIPLAEVLTERGEFEEARLWYRRAPDIGIHYLLRIADTYEAEGKVDLANALRFSL
jgi:hypothetical protein